MALSIGIVGLPNVGKSTLFNALTDNNVLAANYPFATIEPNTGVVPIPDARLEPLAKLYNTTRIIPATVTFVDIAGLVAGAHKGEGLGNQFLSHIRSCSAICQVVRAFADPNVQHVTDRPDPQKDIDVINTELILADLQTIDNRLPKLEKEAKADPKLKPQLGDLMQAKKLLDEGQPLIVARPKFKEEAWDWLRQELQLLTMKPMIYVFNVDETALNDDSFRRSPKTVTEPAKALFICAKLEDEVKGLDGTDALELLKSYGQTESGLVQLIHAAYDTLSLQSFLTAGPKEVRAWTIPKGTAAPDAAGTIHSDMQRGFIAATVVSYQNLIDSGSLANAKSAGKVRTEGKDYVMQPDDVVEFRFNV